MRKLEILGVPVESLEKGELQRRIGESVRQKRKAIYAYANIHAVNLAQKDRKFRDLLRNASTVYCDGEGVRLGARMLGMRFSSRIVLTYWIWELCAFCEENGFSIFFLGSEEATLQRATENLKRRYAGLKVAGWQHGYFLKQGLENDRVIKKINDAGPDILFVGFGMPLQEHWIAENVSRLDTSVIMPAGSMMEYAAGTKSHAPAWMANNGMEWLYRLLQEPMRLGPRYLLGNPLFMVRVMMQRLGMRKH